MVEEKIAHRLQFMGPLPLDMTSYAPVKAAPLGVRERFVGYLLSHDVGERVGRRVVPFNAREPASAQAQQHLLHCALLLAPGDERLEERQLEGRADDRGEAKDCLLFVGQPVEAGAVVLVLEARKMEHSLTAPWDARGSEVKVKAGDRVEEGVDLVVLEPLG